MRHVLIMVLVFWTASPAPAELQNVGIDGRAPNAAHLQPIAIDLQFLERFALAADRASVLAELVPGTEEFYYFSCLHQQEQGDFDAVEALLESWVAQHGKTPQVVAIRNRQALLRYPSAPEATLDYLISHFDLSFDHQRQVPGEAPDLPTALDPDLIRRETLLKRALANTNDGDTVEAFRPRAYDWLAGADLSAARRRDLLQRLTLPDIPRLPELIANDLAAPGSGGFGSIDIHTKLLRERLDALIRLNPDLLGSEAFVETYLRRLVPGNDNPNWQRDPEVMEAYLDRILDFAQKLPPAHTSLKAHALYHRLAFDRSQGVYDRERFMQYLQVPRNMEYINPEFSERDANEHIKANLGHRFGNATALPAIHSDQDLVADYLRRFFETQNSYDAFKPYIRESYLRRIFAEAKLLQGEGDLEQWYAWLEPNAVEALKNRVDLAFAPGNRQQFAPDETVTLDVDVKNVDRLLVKVFEIDTKNYYREFNREINSAIDLDGLVANHEQVHTYTEAPLRSVRRQFTFPELAGRGVWIIEFVGNGTSSRVVVAKGALHYLGRTGPAGQVFTVFDEAGTKVPDASIWFTGRSYPADENGEITLPFSTEPSTKHFLLCAGDFASRAQFLHRDESYSFAAGFHVDRESLRSGTMAKVAVRAALYLNGTSMPVSLVKDPVLTIRTRTHDEIESSQEIAGVVLRNGELLVQDFRVPENLVQVDFSLSGTVERLTDGEPQALSSYDFYTANGINGTNHTATILLTRSGAEYALEVRDKSGNPIDGHVVRLHFVHKEVAEAVEVSLKTDSAGRIALGTLPDIQVVAAQTAAGTSQWLLVPYAYPYPSSLHGSSGDALRLPYVGTPPSRVGDAASLIEIRQGQYVADWTSALAIEDAYLTISELPAGDYLLHLKESDQRITIRITDGEKTNEYVASETRVLEIESPTALQIQSFNANSDEVKIQVGGANAHTRVHVVATRFLPERDVFDEFNVTTSPNPSVQTLDDGYALYTSGRRIGDEYRYVLERRFATKFPGNMLERPSLLLNPWVIQETDATQEEAAAGEPPPPAADMVASPPPAPPSAQPPANRMSEPVDYSPDFDFLDGDAAALYNLQPDENGVVTIARDELNGRQYLQIVATDPFATVSRSEALAEQPWTPRDLRLANALDPASHVVEKKRVRVLESGASLEVSLTGDADVQVYDSVASVLRLFMTLNADSRLREFSFLARWPELTPEERRAKFSEFESHELNLFLYHKDREFFDATVRPYLANKYQKTFIDHWLLEEELGEYLDPWRLGQLNLVEKILLSKRVTGEGASIAAYVRDAVEMIPPDPEGADYLFMTALSSGGRYSDRLPYGLTLERLLFSAGPDNSGSNLQNAEIDGSIRIRGNYFDYDANNAPARSRPEAKPEPKPEPTTADVNLYQSYIDTDAANKARKQYRLLYRAPETTKALVETSYYKLRIEQATSDLIPVNAFWRDYAEADSGAPFLSEHIAEVASSFTEAMLALAVLDLPFESPKHEAESDAGAYTLRAGGAAIAFYKDIEPAAESADETPILVSQNFFREDDRVRHEGNQQFEKFVTDEFLTGVVYGCQITVTNPTATPHQIEVLRQVPAGAIPVNSGRYTKSERMALGPYSTTRLEYFFYFPNPGQFAHYPVHVSREGEVLAFAEPREMNVVETATTVDTSSWQYVSQQGTPAEVLGHMKQNNLNRLDLRLIRWRMGDKSFYRQVIDLLNERVVYTPELWAYAFQHNDADAIRTYLQYRPDFVSQTGPYIASELLTTDPVERKLYQHMEFAPLINPRAHHLEGKWMITNAQLERQYTSLLHVLAHRPAPRQEDLLALTYYFLLQDRVAEALETFARVQPDQLPTRIQYDYLRAYLAFYEEDPAAAATIAAEYQEHPAERWRTRFAEVAAQAAAIKGDGGTQAEGDLTQDTLAAQEPQLDLEVKEASLVLNYSNLTSCEISFHPIDLEMLFTRSPFALAGSNVFAGVKPVATQTIALDETTTRMEVPLPDDFAQRHVVIKAEAAGISRSDIRYASDLVVQVVERYGQVVVTGKADNRPLPKVYVKVFAQMENGTTQFYRDGYTDLRGRFDYASSSTLDIGAVREFSLLVISEDHGAEVLTAAPPAR